MNSQRKKFMGLTGLILGISGFLLSIPAGLNNNYLLLAICLVMTITGVYLIGFSID